MAPQPLTPEDTDRLARKRVAARMGFYFHAAMYVAVNAVIFSVSEYGFGHRRWSIFPLLGWGLGLVLHGVSVFALGSGRGFRERMVQKERKRIQRTRGGNTP